VGEGEKKKVFLSKRKSRLQSGSVVIGPPLRDVPPLSLSHIQRVVALANRRAG